MDENFERGGMLSQRRRHSVELQEVCRDAIYKDIKQQNNLGNWAQSAERTERCWDGTILRTISEIA